MGLDISMYRVLDITLYEVKEDSFEGKRVETFNIEDEEGLEIFNKFMFTKDVEYFDTIPIFDMPKNKGLVLAGTTRIGKNLKISLIDPRLRKAVSSVRYNSRRKRAKAKSVYKNFTKKHTYLITKLVTNKDKFLKLQQIGYIRNGMLASFYSTYGSECNITTLEGIKELRKHAKDSIKDQLELLIDNFVEGETYLNLDY